MSRSWVRQYVRWLTAGIHRLFLQALYLRRRRLTYTADSRLGALDDTRIRLLRPLKHRYYSLGVLEFVLEEVDINNLPTYVTLSYTWNPAEPDEKEKNEPSDLKPILVNSHRFDIYPNLFDALCQLEKHGQDGYIWIDAICINQKDDTECSSQVALMDTIYKTSSKTIVWLGRETAYTARAARVLAACEESAKQATIQLLDAGTWNEPIDATDPAALDKYGVPRLCEKDWAALADVFGRRYFSRAWMVQEVALSCEIEVLCGSVTFNWDSIGIFAIFLTITHYLISMASQNLNTGLRLMCKGAHGANSLHLTRQWCTGKDVDLVRLVERYTWRGFKNKSQGLVLLRLLQMTPTVDVTDPRDRYFSKYGIMKHMVPDQHDTSYRPEYWLSEAEVLRRYCELLILETGELSILAWAGEGYSRKVEGLPSWVPYFDVRPNTMAGLADTAKKLALDASGVVGYQHREHIIDGPMLHVRAYEVGRIVACSETNTGMPKGIVYAETAALLFDHTAVIYPYTGQSRTEAFWRTAILDHDLISRPAPADLGKSFKAWFSWYLAVAIKGFVAQGGTLSAAATACHKLDLLAGAETPVSQFFPTWTEILSRLVYAGEVPPPDGSGMKRSKDVRAYAKEWWKEAQKFETIAIYSVLLRQALFTNHGHIALGPRGAVVGDSIWIVAGCPVALVLRRTSDDTGDQPYKLIGESYVHGIMNGEAVSEETEWKSIGLC
ncbi:hypothetical protein OIDMADRAFT_27504 [Oidiodendron maius Zn]|uniref:Heterokaryon incompatibility domain-containing protein n=1 Tax=Oidiodendron maius (strain Zn) TaxID=913774 RepID=A0A0C3HIY5_OIDMZ|nr:hypothetical protein OIDMADRAFT_27504 [Oidiodendron maius Zn]